MARLSKRPVVQPHMTNWNTSGVIYAKPMNFDGIIIKYTSSDTDEHTIPHHLSKTPQVILLGIPNAAVTYHQSTAANKANIYLTASAVTSCTVKILAF